MQIAAIIALLQTVVAALPGAITTVQQLYLLGEKFAATLAGTEPTAADRAALRSAIDADVAIALTPLPPAQPGDPDYKPET